MKRHAILIFTTIAALLLLTIGVVYAKEPKTQYQSFTSTECGYSLRIPSTFVQDDLYSDGCNISFSADIHTPILSIEQRDFTSYGEIALEQKVTKLLAEEQRTDLFSAPAQGIRADSLVVYSTGTHYAGIETYLTLGKKTLVIMISARDPDVWFSSKDIEHYEELIRSFSYQK